MTRQSRACLPRNACFGLGFALLLGGCQGVQSSLDPAGADASRIWLLAAIMTVGAAIILLVVGAALFLAVKGSDVTRRHLASSEAIIAGGIAFPVVTLTLLLIYGVWVMRAGLLPAATPPQLRIDITGEQWWWRVSYRQSETQSVESANELRVPVGRDVEIRLRSPDVIHSFWVPNLAGKLDMIPGRTTILTLRAERPGAFRGQCAEYCGGAHALMALDVIAMPQADYDRWLGAAATPIAAPADAIGQRGQALFVAAGCGACHTVGGTTANGRIGPDLSRIGERRSIAAASLPNCPASLTRFIENAQHIKPGNRMPPFAFLKRDEIESISHYLAGLK
jgi:cytochrome c oxidase subunit 2